MTSHSNISHFNFSQGSLDQTSMQTAILICPRRLNCLNKAAEGSISRNICCTCFHAVYSNATRASIANPPNSAQLGGNSYHSPQVTTYIRVRAVVWACGRGQTRRQTDRQTHRQTDTQTRVTTIHFASSSTQAKCTSGQNNLTQGRIATAHGWFSRIRQEAPMCTPYTESQVKLVGV